MTSRALRTRTAGYDTLKDMSEDDGFRWVLGNDGKAHALMWLSEDQTHGGLLCRDSVSRPSPPGPTDRRCSECLTAESHFEAEKRQGR